MAAKEIETAQLGELVRTSVQEESGDVAGRAVAGVTVQMAGSFVMLNKVLADDGASFEDLVAAGQLIAASAAGSKWAHIWAMADLALRVDTSYGEGSLSKWAESEGINLTYSTARSYRAMAKAFPEYVRRRTVSPAAHMALAGLENRAKLIARKKPWTKSEALEYVAKRKQKEIAKDADKQDTTSSTEADTTSTEADTTSSEADDTTTSDHQPEPREVTAEDRAQAVTYEHQAVRIDAMAAELWAFEFEPRFDEPPGYSRRDVAGAKLESLADELHRMAVANLIPLEDGWSGLEDDDPLVAAAREELTKLIEAAGE